MNSFYDRDELERIGFKRIGENVLLSRKASIYGADRIAIGSNVRIDDFCILSGNITLHDYVHIAAYCGLFGGTSGIIIEDYCGVSSRTAIYADSDDYSGIAFTNPTVPDKYRKIIHGGVILKKHSIIGSGSTILPGVEVGEGAAVGSMSLVNKPLAPWSVCVGIPCKKIKDRSRELLLLEKEFEDERKND